MSEFGNTLEEMDLEAFMNARDWLEKALIDAGATVTDAGMGMGRADVGISLEGAPFSISMSPRPIRPVGKTDDETVAAWNTRAATPVCTKEEAE